jgi:YHS domain-containing protein
MFRVILYLLITVILISVLRGVLGVIFKGFGDLLNPKPEAPATSVGKQAPLAGELKKDPCCGTYVAASTSIQETVGSETFYFCSKACRDKYLASLAR